MTTITRRSALALAGATAAASALPRPALSQAWPNRPIRVVLPFGAGGVADVTARVVTERLGDRIGQRFTIENVPGAGGATAAQRVLQAPADGYTLALFSNGTAVSVGLFNRLPFDPVTEFVPISTLGIFDFVLATGADTGFRTLADLVAAARARPGTINIGTVTAGSTQHLSALLFAGEVGIQVEQITFRNTPDAVVALLRNDVQVVIDSFASLKASFDDRRAVALATTGSARSQTLPQVPTVAEAGGPATFDVTSWNALFAKAGTPPEAIEGLSAGLREVLGQADIRARLLDLGIEARWSQRAELANRLVLDIERWSGVINRAGIPKQ
jgi:tripartite-type tricarboxylate transporter receptor subunit TctC